MKKIFFIAIPLFLWVTTIWGREWQFRHYTMDDGLSCNTIFSVAQDRYGFWWMATRKGLNRFDGISFKTYHIGESPYGLSDTQVNTLYEDPHHQLWIGTGKGVYLYEPRKDSFRKFQARTATGDSIDCSITKIIEHQGYIYMLGRQNGIFRYHLKSRKMDLLLAQNYPTATSIAFEASGRIWIGFYGASLHYSDNRLLSVQEFTEDTGKAPFTHQTVSGIIPTEQGQLYVATSQTGLWAVDTQTGKTMQLMKDYDDQSRYIHNILRNGNEIWTATERGLYIYEMLTRKMSHYQYESTNPFSLNDNAIQCIYQDHDDGIWIGTYFGGINYVSPKSFNIQKFIPRPNTPSSLHGRRVRNMVEDSQKRVWIGTEDNGISCFTPQNETFQFVEESQKWPNIHSLYVTGNELWVGTFGNGLKVIDINTRKVIQSYTEASTNGQLSDNNVFAIQQVGQKLYLGLFNGLTVYDLKSKTFHKESGVPANIIQSILHDRKGRTWLAYYGKGIYMQTRDSKLWTNFSTTSKKHHIASDIVLGLFEDSNGTIWMTTENAGLSRYQESTGRFIQEPILNNKITQMFFSVLEDRNHMLWISTDNGLIIYDPKTKLTQIINKSNGLLDNDFNYNSALFTSNGNMLMGSSSGFIMFNPQHFLEEKVVPNIVATDLTINNRTVTPFMQNSPLTESIMFTDELILNHDQNSLSLHISVLHTRNDRKIQKEYMLEGYDREWSLLPFNGIVKYTELPAGHYKLLVRTLSADGKELTKRYQLPITIKPPFYLSIWACGIYILTAILASLLVYRFTTQRRKMQERISIEKFEREKEQELYRNKISFFTDVAHEVRTPLTLIKGPLDDIIKKENISNEDKEDLHIMSRNVQRLLTLTNQLLDFRKIERDGIKLNFQRKDVCKILQDIYTGFIPVIQEKNIKGELSISSASLMASIDQEAFIKIISNLMTNAIKYGEREISVTMDADINEFTVTVCNDGPQITTEMREKVFMPFFRASTALSQPGTGIGLPLARSLTELHGGQLSIMDDEQLNVFKLTLPIKQEESLQYAPVEEEALDDLDLTQETDENADDNKQTTILIVEDNPDMLTYERSRLQTHYNVLTATNGEEALLQLSDNEVNLVVSDVLMEPMGGFELCQHIKEDVNTSHIPVILLTALTLDSAKIKGMESGADSYIEKPFSMDYLLSVIQNLLKSREMTRKIYATSPFISAETLTDNRADKKFIERLENIVHENLGNSEFNIKELASLMCMSKTSLNRKIRGTMGMTPNNYIKVERLKMAAILLKNGEGRINEVCYTVGFTSPSYFTQCFSKQFGLLPKDFIVQN